ncbi:D-Ala-D-Ala carboxypeptidase family metallohydrolase [Herbaspirillum aquaticum]|uniref:Peptidase M15 n=2 Tax=Pseudomonadota TaxID=1224 RepID=A0A225SVT1_9BURK|nr:D-Ala-D-Ala carboxypeptidase family metallohydrolase [Herbaspirillum aquaticum]OWY35310.1 peptidase M15 [Herbaspirillum aquaticum]
MDKLTDHFSLSEMTVSETAARKGIDNTPSPAIIKNLTRTAQLLERVRVLLGSKPILVSSGYRSPALNAAVGGSKTSAHMQGLAADFICPGFGTPLAICQRLDSLGVEFDQLIQEGAWVHIGLAAEGIKPRRQVLTAKFSSVGTTYGSGL